MPDTTSPVMDTLEAMIGSSLKNSRLSEREYMLTRIAALVASDASAASYAMNVGAAVDTGVTLEDVQGVLVAVAPVVGTARIASAALAIAEGLGFVVGVLEAELEAQAEAQGT